MKQTVRTDYIVVGSGIAGLRAAIEIAEGGQEVLLLTKDLPTDSNTVDAQGGIAAALSDDDEIGLHERDTLAAGDGLCDPAAVKVLVEDGPRCIYELIDWGAQFDRDGLDLAFTREGAHSKNRVLHARGDSTGAEIANALLLKVATFTNIRFLHKTFTAGLRLLDGRCTGITAIDEPSGEALALASRAVLLASGGCGQVYRETSNPPQATGDGMALAFLAGAEMLDMEFIQFHPTALAVQGAPRFLLSEALRGEGALLRNEEGHRFMPDYHPQAELAPRDVVARAIIAETRRTGHPRVYLDMTHLTGRDLQARFPRIFKTVLAVGLDLSKDLVPVLPAAHYAMGGVRTDLSGRTSVAGLFAAGEVAATGVHGANRLASNSLLEGLVFGARAGSAMLDLGLPIVDWSPDEKEPRGVRDGEAPGVSDEIRALAWEKVGMLRDGPSLSSALERLETLVSEAVAPPTRKGLEARNMALVVEMIARCGLFREESRGAHYRTDFPARDDVHWKCHTLLSGAGVSKSPVSG